MGTICTNIEKQRYQRIDESNRNAKVAIVQLGKYCEIQIINGIYRHHSSQTLLAIAESNKLDMCEQLADFCTDIRSYLLKELEILVNVPIRKNAPYKKFLLLCLSRYQSGQTEFYQQQFVNMLRQIIQLNNDLTLQMYPVSQSTQRMGNQIILALLFRQLCNNTKKDLKLSLISYEKKTLNLFRYQIMKTQNYENKIHFSR